jgi:carnitine 3-dehydrogenase / betainyl-CoA thioesterase
MQGRTPRRSSTTGTHYTVETHLSFLQEVRPDDRLHVDTQVLGFDERRLHAFHTLNRSHDRVTLAAAEQMFVHVDARERRAAPAGPEVLTRIERIARAHADLPRPERAGRWIVLSAAAT